VGRRRRITRRSIEPDVMACVSYVDTVCIRLPKLMEKREFRQLRLAMFCAQGTRKRRIVLTKRYYPKDLGGWFFVMSIHQPTQAAIELLVREGRRLVEVHVALDLLARTWADAWNIQDYLEHRIQRTARPTEYSTRHETTVYVGRLKSRIGPEIALYSDYRSKTGHSPCCHTELRVIGAGALRAAGLSAADLLTLDHRKFWDSHLRLRKPPSFKAVVDARLRMLRRRRLAADPNAVDLTVRKYFRACNGHQNTLVGSDLLCLLRLSANVAGKNPSRLFTRESHAWMLPASSQNALWFEDASTAAAGAFRSPIGPKPADRPNTKSMRVQQQLHPLSKEHEFDDDACLATIMSARRVLNPACPHCGCVPARFYRIAGRPAYICRDCDGHIYPCVGTPFEGTRVPLHLWFQALRLAKGSGKRVSAAELQRYLGVTYKTAWRMRTALEETDPFWQALSVHAKARNLLGSAG
jgi:hypothetical protein